ncbi:hypothetical protein BJ508DRAFT_414087 [Ascobolus immersus RN42]|uniref:Uncharacterized protein n=1 Tax=Ascobolus immersus RN42 TaxID=1160509 RepID=A0A3N4I8M1_ASCIM|nr:hypothetical protein BJ508DRAFT_414087 [Ascobolus immersus RN42]
MGSIFGVVLLLNIIGLCYLMKNGVAASNRFLQAVTTTANSSALHEAASLQTHGGGLYDDEFPEELTKLVVKFGKLPEVDMRDSRSMVSCTSRAGLRGDARDWMACFGTEEEVEPYPLRRGRRGSSRVKSFSSDQTLTA